MNYRTAIIVSLLIGGCSSVDVKRTAIMQSGDPFAEAVQRLDIPFAKKGWQNYKRAE